MEICDMIWNNSNEGKGENMVFYFLFKLGKKDQVSKEIIFHENTKKYIQFLFKFHSEIMVLSIGFVLSWIQNFKFEKLWNNKNKKQVFLNLTSQHGVQKYFYIRKFNEINLCEVIR